MQTKDKTVLDLKNRILNFTERDVRRVVSIGRSEEAVRALRSTLKEGHYAYTVAEWVIQDIALTILRKAHAEDWNLATVFQFIHIMEDILLSIYARDDIDVVRGWGGALYTHIIRPWSSTQGPILVFKDK